MKRTVIDVAETVAGTVIGVTAIYKGLDGGFVVLDERGKPWSIDAPRTLALVPEGPRWLVKDEAGAVVTFGRERDLPRLREMIARAARPQADSHWVLAQGKPVGDTWIVPGPRR
jgi:hypothetical protein